MSSDFLTHTCVSVRCGTCKEPYCGGDDDYGIQHFDSREAAIKDITDVGWEVDGDTAACRGCAVAQACAEHGHVWDPDWWACRCGCSHLVQPMNLAHTQPMQCRNCARCDAHEDRPVTQ